MGLTNKELDVLDKLSEAFSEFARLPILHSEDINEFRRSVHAAQTIVLSRPGMRELQQFTMMQEPKKEK